MRMNEETKTIFDMLKNGQITAEEAEKLYEAINVNDEMKYGRVVQSDTKSGMMPSKLRVTVLEQGSVKVNVSLPFGVVRYALRVGKNIGNLYGKFAGDVDVAEILRNIDIDEILDSLEAGENELPLTIADVEVPQDRINVIVVLE